MHARVSTIYGTTEQGDTGMRTFRDELLPTLKQTEGCKGAALLTNRSTGKTVAITLWEDEQAMQASEEAANALRQQAADDYAATEPPTVDRYEVVVWEV
jgi:heme-degrading monooxygenase HmoA